MEAHNERCTTSSLQCKETTRYRSQLLKSNTMQRESLYHRDTEVKCECASRILKLMLILAAAIVIQIWFARVKVGKEFGSNVCASECTSECREQKIYSRFDTTLDLE